MFKIIIQAGHSGKTSGATGAPNEQSFNIDISDKVAEEMRNRGMEVKRVNADPTDAEIAGDWNLFLAIHYDADIYGTGGGLVDYCDPANDEATIESQRIAYLLRQEYFGTTKIVNHPERSNDKTRGYYMWARLSKLTPCVLIECGVGMHIPDDHTVLHFNRPLVVEGIVKGLCLAFNIPYTTTEPTPQVDVTKLQEEIIDLKKYRESLTKTVEELRLSIEEKDKTILSSSQEVGVLKAENQKLTEDIEYYKPYKARYENALTQIPNSMTGWQLIRAGIKKLQTKK